METTESPIASAATLARQTHDRLRIELLAGHWLPGQKLLMHRLRERYGVGASPLREALSRLSHEGLVVHNDQRGFVVAGASAEALADLVRTRIWVEGRLLEQSLAARHPAWEEAVVLAFHRLSRTPRSVESDSYEENPEWERLHRAFHFSMLNGGDAPLLLGFCEQLYDQAYRYRQLAARSAYKKRNELDEHRALFEAVMGNRLGEAQQWIGTHYQRTAQLFSAAI